MKHGMMAFFFFQKKSPRVGFFTTPILVGGPTQATTAARQQFKVDKIKGINDMKCHAMLWNSYVSYVSYDSFAIVLDCFFVPIFFSAHLASKSQQRRGFGVLLYVLLWSEVQYVISKWDLARRKQLQYAAHPQDTLPMRMRSGVALRDWEDEKLLVTCPLGHWQVSARDLSWDD